MNLPAAHKICSCNTLHIPREKRAGLWSLATWWGSREVVAGKEQSAVSRCHSVPWRVCDRVGEGGWAALDGSYVQAQWVRSKCFCICPYLSSLCIFLKSWCIYSLGAILKWPGGIHTLKKKNHEVLVYTTAGKMLLLPILTRQWSQRPDPRHLAVTGHLAHRSCIPLVTVVASH